nr:MAG TPA: hypothetical protein [Caudoviricetes sp.]
MFAVNDVAAFNGLIGCSASRLYDKAHTSWKRQVGKQVHYLPRGLVLVHKSHSY